MGTESALNELSDSKNRKLKIGLGNEKSIGHNLAKYKVYQIVYK